MKHLVSKFFRVAQEGATTDGREISREHIQQMAANYDPKKYGARVWLEHLRGLLPDSAFNALGDVIAVKAEEEDGKLGLYAQVAPTSELVAINQRKQKVYSSIEIDPDFSDTGEAYLVGLAVTDSPASLGTEAMAFSAKAEVSLFADRKQRPENLFTAACEVDLEFKEDKEKGREKPSLFSRVQDILGRNKKDNDAQFSDISESVTTIAESQQAVIEQIEALDSQYSESADQFKALKQAHDDLQEKFNSLSQKLSQSPDASHQDRGAAAGGGDVIATDC